MEMLKGISLDLKEENLNRLKEIFPEVFEPPCVDSPPDPQAVIPMTIVAAKTAAATFFKIFFIRKSSLYIFVYEFVFVIQIIIPCASIFNKIQEKKLVKLYCQSAFYPLKVIIFLLFCVFWQLYHWFILSFTDILCFLRILLYLCVCHTIQLCSLCNLYYIALCKQRCYDTTITK